MGALSDNPSQAGIDDLLRFMVEKGASDLHLKPMRPPLIRLQGKLLPLKTEPLPPEMIQEMLGSILTERMTAKLESHLAVDFGHSVPGVSRFRASVFYQRGTLSATFRRVPFDFPSLDEWGLPEVLKEFAKLRHGLVVVTGPTGSGKSSTLAAMMQLIAETRLDHIVTIEDPIEFLLKDQLAAVTQREVYNDTPGFSDALRNALRQDPDVIMVGEMRDRTTMQTVLTAAETGHLVFSTLHTNDAVQTIDRFIDGFDAGHHRQIRQQLGTVLQAVVSLKLVEKVDDSGLIAAVEILRHTPQVAKLIRDGNLEQLNEEIENSVAYFNMQTMNQSLAALVLNGQITWETALEASNRPSDLDLILRKFLYASLEGREPAEGEAMADSYSDFSKIRELQEIKKAYDEQEERHRSQSAELLAEIERQRAELDATTGRGDSAQGELDELRTENGRLNKQVKLVRQEYEAKIERLNARIRDLSESTSAAIRSSPSGSERKGFFRR